VAKKIRLLGGVAIVVLLMAWARVAIDGRLARNKADELAAVGQNDESVGFYDRALHMYWPGSPDVARAVDALEKMAAMRAAAGDVAGALHAWRVLRSGLYAARGLYQPYPAVIALSETNIAAMEASQLGDARAFDRQLKLLQKSFDPSRFWAMAALLGFVLWVGAAFEFIWKGLTPEGKIKAGAAAVWGGVFVAGWLLWIVSLRLA
jgi:hypothetical protein